MLRSRRSAISSTVKSANGNGSAPLSLPFHNTNVSNNGDEVEAGGEGERGTNKRKQQPSLNSRRRSWTKILLFVVMAVLSINFIFSFIRFRTIMMQNKTINTSNNHYFLQQQEVSSSNSSSSTLLRSSSTNTINSNRTVLNLENDIDYPLCPKLPKRLQEYLTKLKTDPFQKLSHENFKRQLPFMVPPNYNNGTTGNIIRICPTNRQLYIRCIGVYKKYQSPSVYLHVKHILTMMHNSTVTPRILYADDPSLVIVEEDLGHVTMMNSRIPLDFEIQITRIHCILQYYGIIHRDITWRNFIIDLSVGYISIIDFGDAYIWKKISNNNENDHQSESWRNMVNLFNIWWKSYNEEEQFKHFVSVTNKNLKGERIWQPEHRWTSLQANKVGRAMVLNSQLQQQQILSSNHKDPLPLLEDND